MSEFLWEVVGVFEKYNGAVTALGTIVIAIFTFVLARVTGRQAKLTRESIDLARREFVSTHRPRLILRDVHLIGEEVMYMLVNVGDTSAIIVESLILAEFVERGSRLSLRRSSGHDDLGRLTIAGGESKDLVYPLPPEISFAIKYPGSRRIGIDGKPPVYGERYFVGAISYADDLGVQRRSAFRRRWDDDSLTFVRLSDERDQEYSD